MILYKVRQELRRWVKCSQCRYQYPSSDHQHPRKHLVAISATGNLKTQEAYTGEAQSKTQKYR